MLNRLALALVAAGVAFATPPGASAQDARVMPFRREMATDRPDVTESPRTVERGHTQAEMDLFGYTEDRAAGIRSREWSAGNINLKFGVSDAVDVQFITPLFVRSQATSSAGILSDQRGTGDLTVRAKFNLWGNDGGPTALAVMPFVTIPTANEGLGAGAAEYGLIVPFGFSLPLGFSAGVMSEVDVLHRDAASGHFVEFVNSATIGHHLVGPFSMYTELVGAVTPWETAGWRATGNAGVTISVSSNTQLDVGGNFGITEGTDRVTAFLGFSIRR